MAALDPSGAEVWRTTIEDRSDAPPLVSGDFVVVDGCRAVHVLDAESGQRIRSTEELIDAVGVLDDRVYGTAARTGDGKDPVGVRGVALDDTGSERHIAQAGGDGPGFARTMTLAGQRLMGTQGDRLFVYPGEGSSAAQVQLPVVPEIRVLPVGNDRAVVGAPDGSVVGVDLNAMRRRWQVVPEQKSERFDLGLRAVGRTALVSALGSRPAGQDHRRADANPVAETIAIRAGDGAVAWRRPGFVVGATSSSVVVLLSESALMAVDLRTGRDLWTRATPWLGRAHLSRAVAGGPGQPAVVVDGTVALTDWEQRGATVAVDVRTGRELWTLDGSLQPVPLETTFGVARGPRPQGSGGGDGGVEVRPNGERVAVDVLDPRTGRVLWSTTLTEAGSANAAAWQHLGADPARSQTIVLDLPGVLGGGCP